MSIPTNNNNAIPVIQNNTTRAIVLISYPVSMKRRKYNNMFNVQITIFFQSLISERVKNRCVFVGNRQLPFVGLLKEELIFNLSNAFSSSVWSCTCSRRGSVMFAIWIIASLNLIVKLVCIYPLHYLHYKLLSSAKKPFLMDSSEWKYCVISMIMQYQRISSIYAWNFMIFRLSMIQTLTN